MGNTIIVEIDKIAAMFQMIRKSYPEFTEKLEEVHAQLRLLKEDAFDFPDLGKYANQLQIVELFKGANEDGVTPDTILQLYQLFGRTINALRDNTGRIKAISYIETLPNDMLPMLVLDASSRWAKLYQMMSDSRQNIKQLLSAPKNYKNATFHVCNKGGGKGTINRNPQKYIDGVVKEIMDSKDDLLVVHHLNLNIEFKEDIQERTTDFKHKVGFLHYGIHAGTNEFVNRKKVILAGTEFHDPWVKHSMIRTC